mmetsp:Transcript_29508/g.96362  ORF Transcript_29508/g.96362 Transcript_29508/m.96362 type:complete len:415 (-) Transcript_29508:1153-2397(-)
MQQPTRGVLTDGSTVHGLHLLHRYCALSVIIHATLLSPVRAQQAAALALPHHHRVHVHPALDLDQVRGGRLHGHRSNGRQPHLGHRVASEEHEGDAQPPQEACCFVIWRHLFMPQPSEDQTTCCPAQHQTRRSAELVRLYAVEGQQLEVQQSVDGGEDGGADEDEPVGHLAVQRQDDRVGRENEAPGEAHAAVGAREGVAAARVVGDEEQARCAHLDEQHQRADHADEDQHHVLCRPGRRRASQAQHVAVHVGEGREQDGQQRHEQNGRLQAHGEARELDQRMHVSTIQDDGGCGVDGGGHGAQGEDSGDNDQRDRSTAAQRLHLGPHGQKPAHPSQRLHLGDGSPREEVARVQNEAQHLNDHNQLREPPRGGRDSHPLFLVLIIQRKGQPLGQIDRLFHHVHVPRGGFRERGL